jgi:Domain of unknown function (DUF4939)
MPPRRNTPAPTPAPIVSIAPVPEERRSPTPEAPEGTLPPIAEVPEESRRSPSPDELRPVPDYRRSRSVPDDSRSVQGETTANLTEAILLMTQELRRRENPTRKAKIKEPDTFDGSDPRKLNNFILQCNLFFRSSSAYDDDTAKVSFALSYLRGMALDYFEPSIIDADEFPIWMDNWSAFVRNLRIQFGPIDPTADAEDGIDNLKMHDNQHILKYNVEFTRLAIRTGWDDSVLRHRYYSGLAERIKDVMGQQGKPTTLEDMRTLAHSIDSRYWERSREKSRSGKNKADTSDKSDHKSDKSDDKNKSGSYSGNKNKGKANPGKPASTSGSGSSTPSIADKLGKDGKLTPQERQRRFDNHLCLFCGGTGHSAKDCPKASSSAAKAKARAAQVSEPDRSDAKKA